MARAFFCIEYENMSSIVLKNAIVILNETAVRRGSVLIEKGLIKEISDTGLEGDEIIDLGGALLFPGFIDIHIHGAVGIDVNTASTPDLEKMAHFLAGNGVTAWVPTLVPDSDENYRRVIEAVEALMEAQYGRPTAQAAGVHYEGIFANEKMCGALRPEFFKAFTGNETAGIPKLPRGCHITTLAPEITGGIALIKELTREGWVVSIGHTRASIETLDLAFAAGARHLTHFYNAMTGLHHRDVGVVGWAFSREDVTFDIIADGIHVHPDMLRFACLSKGPANVTLISDSVLPTGMGDGEFDIWGERVSVTGGRTQNERGSIAGSVITMRDAVVRMLALGFAPWDIAKMASLNPARLIGIEETHGSIEVGKRADMVALGDGGSVVMSMVGGEKVPVGRV